MEELSKDLRNKIYDGGEDAQTLVEDLVFSIKYSIVNNKFSPSQKLIIKDLANELSELMELSNNSIIEKYELELDDE
jgi:hypothetical protein